MFETVSRRKVICDGGNELLRVDISYPRFDGKERINMLYESICDRAAEYCFERISHIAREACAEGVCRPFLYSLSCKVILEWEALVSVELSASLRRRGERRPMSVFSDIQWWQTEDEIMIPPIWALREYCQHQDCFDKMGKDSVVVNERGSLFLADRKNKIELEKLQPKNDKCH